MILPFMRHLYGEPVLFNQKIMTGEKKHTFRLGNRWKPADFIHFYDLSPRATKATPPPAPIPMFKNVRAMGKNWKKGGELTPLVTAVEHFKIYFPIECFSQGGPSYNERLKLYIGNNEIQSADYYAEIVKNDGLTMPQFEKYFYETCKEKGTPAPIQHTKEGGKIYKKIEGQIIHWNRRPYFEETADKIEFHEEIFENVGGPWDGLPLLVFDGTSKPKKFIL